MPASLSRPPAGAAQHNVRRYMPAYAWTCRVCEFVNAAGTDICSRCRNAAELSAVEIERLRNVAARGALSGPRGNRLTKTSFEVLAWIVVLVVLLPIGWHVHSTYSLTVQWLFYSAVCAVAYAVRKWIYVPIHSELPE